MAVDPEDPGRCAAVYDWDLATRGDPLADLGTLMGSWFDPGEAPEQLSMMPTQTKGWIPRDAAIERYGDLTGLPLDRIDWYLAFGAWKLGVILQQIYISIIEGIWNRISACIDPDTREVTAHDIIVGRITRFGIVAVGQNANLNTRTTQSENMS